VELTYTTMLMRLILSAVLGGLVGFERERAEKPAGLRTHILVCLASTLIMLLSIHVSGLYEGTWFDPGRIAAQVISGMGFLGAGTIIRQGNIVRGLTTAASLWFVAGLGLAIGAGFYVASLIAVLVVLFLFFFNLDKILRVKTHASIEIIHAGQSETTATIIAKVLSFHMGVESVSTERLFDGRTSLSLRILRPPETTALDSIIGEIAKIPHVLEVSIGT